MNKLLIASTALALLVGTPAFAADMPLKAPVYKAPPPAPAYSWSGCYIGGDVGGAWARQNANTASPTLNAHDNQAPDFVTLTGSNAIGGAYAGCNVQFSSWVAGIEGDWSATHLSNTAVGPNNFFSGAPVGTGAVTFSRDLPWIASIRGRLGFTITPTVLLYGTGGAAWARANYSGNNVFTTGCPGGNCTPFAFSTNPDGWVAGGGLEWAAWNNWLLRVEYLHYQLSGASTIANNIGFPGFNTQFNFGKVDVDEVRVGGSYKFDWAAKY